LYKVPHLEGRVTDKQIIKFHIMSGTTWRNFRNKAIKIVQGKQSYVWFGNVDPMRK